MNTATKGGTGWYYFTLNLGRESAYFDGKKLPRTPVTGPFPDFDTAERLRLHKKKKYRL